MVALAEFSNELCEIMIFESAQVQPLAIENLLMRYKSLLTVNLATLGELLQSVQESFDRRYSSLLGLDSTKSRLSSNVPGLEMEPQIPTVAVGKEDSDSQSEATWVKAVRAPI